MSSDPRLIKQIEFRDAEISRLQAALRSSESKLNERDSLWTKFNEAVNERNVLALRLDECRESCARAVAARDVATSRLDKVLALVADLSVSDCPTCHEVRALFGAVVEKPAPNSPCFHWVK